MTRKSNACGRARVLPMMSVILIMGCSSQRFGAHFNDYQKVNSINAPPGASSGSDQVPLEKRDGPPLLTSLRSDPVLLDEPGEQLTLAIPTDIKSNLSYPLSKSEIKSIKREVTKRVLSYERTSKADSISSIKEMPRYKYLTWAGILVLAGILFVAFSAAASALGVLGTIAFTGALVFFILWILKK